MPCRKQLRHLGLVLLFGSFTASAHAVVTSWLTSTSGSFNDRAKWDVGVPTSRDIAVFSRGGAYTVSFPGHLAIQLPANFATDELIIRDRVSFVDFVNLGRFPDSYTVNKMTIGDTIGPSPVLNTTLANFSVATATLGSTPGSFGTLNVNRGRLSMSGDVVIGDRGGGVLSVSGGAMLDQGSGSATLGLNTNSGSHGSGRATISGNGSTWITNRLTIGNEGLGELTIEDGGSVSSQTGLVGVFGSLPPPIGSNPSGRRTGVVTVAGTGSTWTSAESISVGGSGTNSPGQGTLNVDTGGTVTTDRLTVTGHGVVNLNGGQLNAASYSFADSTLQFNTGTLRFTAEQAFDDLMLDRVLGQGHTVDPLQHVAVEGTATLNTSLVVDGGTFSAGQLVNGDLLAVERGTVNLTNQAVVIESGGLFGETLEVAPEMTINVPRGITNRGLVTGDGRLGGPFHNDAAGVLRAEPARSLTLTGAGNFGAGNTNDGQIQLFGGLLDLTHGLTNNAEGFISGSGTIIVGTMLLNHGVMNFSGPATVAGDVTNAATGRIIASGGGPTTFLDDVVNDGEIRTSPGSFSVFFGSVTGSGPFTGAGTVLLEGDLKPGNSPGAMSFGGDLTIGPAASLDIEIGGTLGGTEHDVVSVAGTASLGGELHLNLIDGFEPGPTDIFTVLDADRLVGAFENVASGRRLQLAAGGGWFLVHYGPDSQFDPTQVVLSDFQLVGLAGDYDGNNLVEQADLDLVLVNWGRATPPVPDGWDYSLPVGTIDQEELDRVLVNWGKRFPADAPSLGALGAAAVPEPGTLALSLILLLSAQLGVFRLAAPAMCRSRR